LILVVFTFAWPTVGAASPSMLQKRHPLQAVPMIAVPADEGLL
jgi:hypothetical protein